ncbi:MAG TPA: preprotein translocase subunit YajC [Gaiella sp.]
MGSLIILIAMFALLWVLLIRPQRTKQQKQQQLISSVAAGDEILTVGGLYGIVQEIDEEDDLIVEVAEGIHVRIARRAVASVVKPEDEEEDELEEDDGDVVDAEEPPVLEVEPERETRDLVTVSGDDAEPEAPRRGLFRRRG